jgi:hypothetical protein
MLILICAGLVVGLLLAWALSHPGSWLMSVLVVMSAAILVAGTRAFSTVKAFVMGEARSYW